MPRKLPPVVASLPPPPTSPLVTKLRQDWRWAGISQFIWTFADAFGIVDWDIEALERDFDGSEDVVVPDLVSKLLYSLTWNRQINRENAFENLRKQYLKRLPERNVLGTLEEPVEWATLGLSQKVEILWQLCEWQLDDPARFRSLLKTEDDSASWRVDPIGWDKAGNTYFLFDDNRLWVQRVRPAPPRPPKKSSLKAKRAQRALNRSRPPPKKSHKKKEPSQLEEPPLPPPKKEEVVSGPRRRTQVVFYGNLTPTVEALKRGTVVESTPRSDRSTRSSARIAQETPSKPTRAPPLPLGTRVSRRLRAVDDEWQHVPDEWLETPNKAKRNAGRDDDQESELSELTDEEVHEARLQASGAANGTPKGEALREKTGDSPLSEAPDEPDSNSDWKPEAEAASDAPSGEQDDPDLSPEANDLQPETEEASVKAEDDAEVDPSGVEEEIDDSQEQDEVKLAVEEAAALPDGFIEWEAVCVTLQEWNSFPEQWAKSKDADEKALYRLLVDDVRPQVLEVLEAKEQERLKQEAINNRKRSSRIATRELAREEELKRELAEREMEERMERMRQEETRKAQEEADILARERAREDRMRERQERLMARENAIRARQDDEVRAKEKAERDRERRKRRRDGEEVVSASEDDTDAADGPRSKTNASTPGSSTQNASWELRCEVCLQTGWNLKDEADTVCCDDCGRWQHVTCHDRRDIAEGRGIRDWEQVDFRCKECEERAAAKRRRVEQPNSTSNPTSQATSSATINGSSNPVTASGAPSVSTQHSGDVRSHMLPIDQQRSAVTQPAAAPASHVASSSPLPHSLPRQPHPVHGGAAPLQVPNGNPSQATGIPSSYASHPRAQVPAPGYYPQSSHPQGHYAAPTSHAYPYPNGQSHGQQHSARPAYPPVHSSGPAPPHWERAGPGPVPPPAGPPHVSERPYHPAGYQQGPHMSAHPYPSAVPYYGREGYGPQQHPGYPGQPQPRGPGPYETGQAPQAAQK